MGREIEIEVDRQMARIRQGAAQIYGEDDLRDRIRTSLRERRPLRVKLGMDPSSPDLHLGHTVVLGKLKCFQDLGHVPIFLIGDFTARIGDPSGRKKTRPALSADEVKTNASTYVEQVSRVLDVSRAEVRFNSEWMSQMTPSDFVTLCSKQTVARLLERDDFALRYASGEPISVHEFLYPFVQAYDSVALAADVELGGTDQTFNLLLGREIQRAYGQPPQVVITNQLLVGCDGVDKMSKSLGNSIGITEPPDQIFGKVMSIPDRLMRSYVEALSAGEWDDLVVAIDGSVHPMKIKSDLAHRIVSRLCGPSEADEAAEQFRKVVQERSAPDEIPERKLTVGKARQAGLLEALVAVGLASSNGDARRLVAQGGVSIGGERILDPGHRLGLGEHLIRAGKRRYLRLVVEPEPGEGAPSKT